MCCFVLAHYACCVKTACGECCPQPSSSTDPVLKQPVAKTTHIMCHKQHTGVLNLHPVMCIGVLNCPRCVKITHEMRYKCCFNTCSSKQQHDGDTYVGYFNTAVFAVQLGQVELVPGSPSLYTLGTGLITGTINCEFCDSGRNRNT